MTQKFLKFNYVNNYYLNHLIIYVKIRECGLIKMISIFFVIELIQTNINKFYKITTSDMINNDLDKQNTIFLQQKQLESILSNRRHLDFALKLALGSQAYLHDISQIRDDQMASFQSIQNQLSPLKSQYQTPITKRVKKSRFGAAKQNIKSKQMLSLQKSLLSMNSPQQKLTKQKLQRVQHWIQYIKQHHKFVNQMKISKISQKESKTSSKSKSKILGTKVAGQEVNNFFKQIVYRLQKLQIIQKQQYNAKLLLCQLTESTIREYQLQEKIGRLGLDLNKTNQELVMKIQKIQQLETIIEQLNARQFQNGNKLSNLINQQINSIPLQQSNKTSSCLGYSISDLTQFNQNCMPSTSSINFKNKLYSSNKQENILTISQSPQRRNKIDCKERQDYDTAIQTNQKRNINVKFANLPNQNAESYMQEKSNSSNQQSMLLMSLELKQSVQLKPCRLFEKQQIKCQKKQQERHEKQEEDILQKKQKSERSELNEDFYRQKAQMKSVEIGIKQNLGQPKQMKNSIDHPQSMEITVNKSQTQCQCKEQGNSQKQQDSLQNILSNSHSYSNSNQFQIDEIKQEVRQLIEQNQNLKEQLTKLSDQINFLRDTKNYQNFIQLPLLAAEDSEPFNEINNFAKKKQPIQQNIKASKNHHQNQNEHQNSQFMTTNTSRFNATDVDANKTTQIQSNKTYQTQRVRIFSLASNVVEHKNCQFINSIVTSAIFHQSTKIYKYQQMQQWNKYLSDRSKHGQEQNERIKKEFFNLIAHCQQLQQKNQCLQNKLQCLQQKFALFQKQADQIQSNLLEIVQNQAESNVLKDQTPQRVPQTPSRALQVNQIKNNNNCLCNPQSKKYLSIFIDKHKLLIQKLKKRTQQLKNIKGIMRKAKQINEKDIEYLKDTIEKHRELRMNQVQNLRKMEFEWKQKFICNKNKQLEQLKLKGTNLQLKLNKSIFKFAKHAINKKKKSN